MTASASGRSRIKNHVQALFLVWRQAPSSFRIGGTILFVQIAVAVTGPFWAPYGFTELATGAPLSGISWGHPFGTDILGRDVFSRVIHGGHIVILLSFSGTFLGLVFGSSLGMLSAYIGGWFDEIVMRLIEALVSIPYLIFSLLLITVAGPKLAGDPILLLFVVAFVFAPRIARMARAAALDIVTRDFVTAARLRGEGSWSIVHRELLPNTTGTLLVEFALRAGYAPVLIGSLGFLGFGMRPPTPEWGLMIAENRELLLASPITVLGPAIMLATLVVGLNLWTEGIARILGHSVTETN